MPRVEGQGESLVCCHRGAGTGHCFSSKCPRARGRKQIGISSSLETPRCHSRVLPGGPQQCLPFYPRRLPSALQGNHTSSAPLEEDSLGHIHLYPLVFRGRSPQTLPLCSVQLLVSSNSEASPGFCIFSYRIKYTPVLSADGTVPARHPRKPLA